MIPCLIIVTLAFIWMIIETDYLGLRVPKKHSLLLLPAPAPVLLLNAGNPESYPMILRTSTQELKDLLSELAKTELEVEEVQ